MAIASQCLRISNKISPWALEGVMTLRSLLASLAVLLLPAASASATGITDNFESYALGSFPSANWKDVGSFDPAPPIAPIPSGTIASTTDAFGNPTKVFATADGLASSGGIYQDVAVSSHYSLRFDTRIDRYSDHPDAPADDWAMQLSFAKLQTNFAFTPQVGIYASSLTREWRLFANSPISLDESLGVSADIGKWYGIELDFDAVTGVFHSVITDDATGTVLTDQFDSIPGWAPGDGPFDSVAFFHGEVSAGDTISDLAVVDNINVVTVAVPEPSSLAGIGLSVLGLLARILRPRGAIPRPAPPDHAWT
jgi:hypothetical protein